MIRASVIALVGILMLPAAVLADTMSYTGTLGSPEEVFTQTFDVTVAGDITLQTFSFGGGTNAADTAIAGGGTDPFVGLFAGTASTGQILTDLGGNPFGTSLDLSNYGSLVGCPPANAPSFAGSSQCGDITMSVDVNPGIYTVLLSDGQYIPNAVFDNGTLAEAFADLTGGQFCNLDINGANCVANGNYALDVTLPSSTPPPPVPEPGTLLLLGAALPALAFLSKRR